MFDGLFAANRGGSGLFILFLTAVSDALFLPLVRLKYRSAVDVTTPMSSSVIVSLWCSTAHLVRSSEGD